MGNDLEKLRERAKRLRQKGLTYNQIGEKLGVTQQKAWLLVNYHRQRRSTNESVKRYKDRNCVPLCDMP